MSRNRTSADNITLTVIVIGILIMLFFCIKSFDKPKENYTLVEYETQTN